MFFPAADGGHERVIVPELASPSPAPEPAGSPLAGLVAARLTALTAACGPRQRLVVGFSGGVDSLLLLCLLRDVSAVPLLAVHVHHGLSPRADDWAAQAQRQCAALGVPCVVRRVQVDRRAPSREGAARAARHAAFAQELRPGDALLLAHHADDQAETLLLRLLRGSGLGGLGAMRAARRVDGNDDVWLWRPLLTAGRADIVAEATRRGLRWIDDESNADTAHDRNFLRHEILPRLTTRWPALARTLTRTARQLADADALLNDYLDGDLEPLLRDDPAGDAGGRATLDAAAVVALPAAKRDALLRRWLVRIGAPVFSEVWLHELAALADSREDAEGELRVGGWEVHRFRGRLHAFPELPAVAAGRELAWDGQGSLVLGPGHGALEAVAPGTPGVLPLAVPAGAVLCVRFRAGGEQWLPAGGSGHRPLKKVLQEQDVPPWLRTRLPLLYVDGELAAVGDYLAGAVCAPAAARPATLHLRWRRP